MGPSRAGYSNAISRKRAKIELVQNFMPALGICKLDEDSITNEDTIVRTAFTKVYEAIKGG